MSNIVLYMPIACVIPLASNNTLVTSTKKNVSAQASGNGSFFRFSVIIFARQTRIPLAIPQNT